MTRECSISTITLITKDEEWHKSTQGLRAKKGKRSESFCGHTILEDQMMIIRDTHKDPRFKDNPLVTKKKIRFYAGIPIHSLQGYKVGTFCVKGYKPRKVTKKEIKILQDLAHWAELELNTASSSRTLADLRKEIQRRLKK